MKIKLCNLQLHLSTGCRWADIDKLTMVARLIFRTRKFIPRDLYEPHHLVLKYQFPWKNVNNMKAIEFHALDYSATPHAWVADLYRLRKEVFADRLSWKVNINNGIEFDEYDSERTTYLIGTWEGVPLAGLRLISTLDPYMVEGPFRDFFRCEPPKHALMAESSRFFVDKIRSRQYGLAQAPLTEMLLFCMHNYAAGSGLESIITVVSNAMGRVVRNAGWHYEVLDTGEASPGEKVLLLNMPVTEFNRQRLMSSIARKQPLSSTQASQWPHRLYIRDTPLG
ncbi:acyl-homoserine-lactone synthase [Pseudomonas sp. GV085]|uniref:acyl-homoserine-lactone synthase n=2 Tax=unclassified Pseudomonas TaxID=196821 RepID=UPI000D4B6BF5|nr:acyl-homoserine-lactone synthase [Pseudomonas sp. GV085]PTR24422.1 acyl homoserine lactone synthase [Pseudomonas sp. GV085]